MSVPRDFGLLRKLAWIMRWKVLYKLLSIHRIEGMVEVMVGRFMVDRSFTLVYSGYFAAWISLYQVLIVSSPWNRV